MGIAMRLAGQPKDLGGGFTVRRLLPAARQRSVGPFLFFDHFGPVRVEPGASHDVRPHPHIGLATVTYLFSGAILHRDSLGSVQEIEPGAINWMTAGRGIVHSERRPPRLDHQPYVNHGIQLWAALPRDREEVEPAFVHTPASAIPHVQVDAASVRVLVGEAFGAVSPVATLSSALYLDVELPAGASLDLPALAQEMAVYAVDARVQLDGQTLDPGELAVLEPGNATSLRAGADAARMMVVGGDALDGPRHIWWNFVSTRKERIALAAQQWEAQAMGQIPGEQEWIPLPAHRFRDTGSGS
ncbi:pirin family protein [Acidovorax sp. RAC01]|uniref:pirin family protein n=1 Tax=Acidovorax sp. RAC01 TaxID=1842533 RepID=UPI00083E7B26|nr:pirin family protein [Acidovorax sp. RAC01]AOG23149.1 pirin family protein [Acidovorax sp. RAC01]